MKCANSSHFINHTTFNRFLWVLSFLCTVLFSLHLKYEIQFFSLKGSLLFFSQIGRTPLHIAADKGHADFVRVLVTKYNAIVDLVTVVRLVYIAIKDGRFFQLSALIFP